jgi:hypothetical protein
MADEVRCAVGMVNHSGLNFTKYVTVFISIITGFQVIFLSARRHLIDTKRSEHPETLKLVEGIN